MTSHIQILREKLGQGLLLCPSVAAVIHDSNGRLLLQEKSSGEGWSLPAGAIEPGETPREAIVRKVFEETGLSIAVEEIVDVFGGKHFRYTYPNGDEVEYVVTLFKCKVTAPQAPIPDTETRSIRYFHSGALPTLALPYPKSSLFGRDQEES
ncbi:NUDIX domain-containing protein [Agrobacterium cavarae]|uniref:NUDIX domain-containing protein n=1 Tax=Agrobacterium cavarae TaxID=2528239 RepID=UPI000DDFA9C7|nr:NUDIX domain-containing protein [Agrobacterium cavarae]